MGPAYTGHRTALAPAAREHRPADRRRSVITRKTFLVQLGGGTWALALGGCGGGGGGYTAAAAPPPAPAPVVTGCSATTISANHGHALAIPVADLLSAVAITYNLQGTAVHTHEVTFTPAQLAQLRAGTAVTVTTSITLAHSHDLTETCA